jgi:hypothetical protein
VRKIYVERKGTKNERTKWKEKGCTEKGNKDRWKRNENRYKGMKRGKGEDKKGGRIV